MLDIATTTTLTTTLLTCEIGLALVSQQQQQGTQLPLLSQPTLPTMGTSGLSYYRPAPDYETAIRNKYGNSILTQLTSNTNSSRNSIPQNQQQSSHPALITDAISTLHNAAAGQQQQN